MQIGDRDWRGHREPGNPADQRAAPVIARNPLELGQRSDRRRDTEEASDDGSGEEPRLPSCVPKDGTDDGTETCQCPRSE